MDEPKENSLQETAVPAPPAKENPTPTKPNRLNPRIVVSSSAMLLVILLAILMFTLARTSQNARSRATPTPTPTMPTINKYTPTPVPGLDKNGNKFFLASALANVPGEFRFSSNIPTYWQAEVVDGSQAINLYDPNLPGVDNLEKSQIFIRFFKADQFLTLSNVTIYTQQELRVNDRPTIRYVIEKKPGEKDFPNQPSWRNQKHTVTDVRVTDTNPSVFYVIAQRPDLNSTVYEQFLADFQAINKDSVLVEPVDEFRDRITKKSFGTQVSPTDSPVTPERFTGYHTGVDVEYTDVAADVPVRAISEGIVYSSSTVDGYGGVMVIQHIYGDSQINALYGHLKPQSMLAAGTAVTAGEQIAVLGRGGSSETDGERKHLHFGIHRSNPTDLRGYVSHKDDLSGWQDPLELFK